eukprot:CAMPEP_0204352134 /NCGR_PEP_ID=MMETSP0469-20131031/31662_1 /ASSEMBLY_ACC=CAM_ASM_000384 /TAXON_ID=2969 /ORGANISM="Oxyrrhis marina" /LENGTH=54 /DNA_ID=CAMNT_0051338823 /DNA_START=126 /DNA_END=290 /DNA_ORIENTATION=-
MPLDSTTSSPASARTVRKTNPGRKALAPHVPLARPLGTQQESSGAGGLTLPRRP